MYKTKAYSAASATSPLARSSVPRRDPTERDVQIEILFCGICHSDLHYKRNEWHDVMPAVYPCVPGHEIVGRVTKVGPAVKKYKAGDLVGVGCLVDSDRTCPWGICCPKAWLRRETHSSLPSASFSAQTTSSEPRLLMPKSLPPATDGALSPPPNPLTFHASGGPSLGHFFSRPVSFETELRSGP